MDMPITRLDALLQAQRAAWQARAPDCAQRMDDLSRLRRAFKARLEDFVRAVSTDFGHRPRVETLLADGVPVLNEIDHVRKHLRRWMRTRRVAADAAFFPAHCEIVTRPLGVVGVVRPWNYPVNLALIPADRCARGRQPCDAEAVRIHAAHLGVAGRGAGGSFSDRACRGGTGWCRHGRRVRGPCRSITCCSPVRPRRARRSSPRPCPT